MKHKRPYWFKWEQQHILLRKDGFLLWEDRVWENRYRTEKARNEAVKNIKSKGHKITEVGCDQ